MSPLAHTLRSRRHQLNLSLTHLATAAGCSKAYLSEIENDRHPNPPSRSLLTALESALDLPPASLTRHADWHATPPSVKAHLHDLTRQLQQARRRTDGAIDLDALFAAGSLHAQPPDSHAPNLAPLARPARSIPLINNVAAGYPTDFTDLDYPARIADQYVASPHLADPDAFAARVVGDSMAPLYREGDIVIFSPAADPTPGSDCFARLLPDHQTTFKRAFFEPDDRIRLQPLNPAYPPRTLHRDLIDGLYPAVFKIQPILPPR